MHLQGKELVSTATQKGARQLVATALTVLLAKVYGVDLTGLQILGVNIDPATVAGAAWIVIAFQLVTFLIHWGGDFASLAPWNSAEKVNGVPRYDTGSKVLDRISAIDDKLDGTLRAAQNLQGQGDQAAIGRLTGQVADARQALLDLKRSAVRYGRYAGFYFYGLYLALPVALSLAALFWPSPNA